MECLKEWAQRTLRVLIKYNALKVIEIAVKYSSYKLIEEVMELLQKMYVRQ